MWELLDNIIWGTFKDFPPYQLFQIKLQYPAMRAVLVHSNTKQKLLALKYHKMRNEGKFPHCTKTARAKHLLSASHPHSSTHEQALEGKGMFIYLLSFMKYVSGI